MEKCHIVQRSTGEIAATRQVNSADDEWRCHHCQCPLVFHPATITTPAWFEYVITAGDLNAPLHCAYLVSEDQTSSSMKIIAQLAPVQQVTHWRCTMCGSHYQGKKQCSRCKTGIYSREK
ncbi:putative zinc ribbon protein [Pectobacterium brasiliense]|uniref:putative zinc ribbon protein n=1 Tax=Pectobacterium brasiliense TaxID=180957 RepID=UPI0032EF5950